MNFLSFLKKILVPEEAIAGLEITDSNLRLVLLNLDKKTGLISVKEHLERPLEPGIIVNGEIKDTAKLYSALLDFKKNLMPPVDYIVASIPSDPIYSKILSFPKSIEGVKLDEAVKLAVDFQLPYKSAEAYCSWEACADEASQKVFVAEAQKNIIDPYLECLRKAFHLIALEFQADSISRAASLEKNKAILLKITSQTSTGFFIIKNQAIIFSRILSNRLPEKKLQEEPEKILSFYESAANEKISRIIDLNQNPIAIGEKIEFPEQNKNPWLAALGAAERGIIPRSEDNFVSLSPISPQKAYKYHKAVGFSSIMTKLIIGLSIFFTAAFLGTWILMITLQQQETGKTDDLSNLPSMPDLTAVEQKIQTANALISTTAGILKTSPRWSILINELQSSVIDGITISSLDFPSAEGVITITGLAKDRPTLNQFRDKLKSSAMLKDVRLPLTNLEQREGIPFTISFQLSNPALIYLK